MSRNNFNRQFTVTQQNSPLFSPTQAPSSFGNQLGKSLDNISNDMKSKADVIYTASFLSDARKSARDIYNRNFDNPEQLNKELQNYKEGLLSDSSPELRSKLDLQYGSIAEQYVNKATVTKNNQLTAQQSLALNQNENQILKDIQFSVRGLFDNEGLSEEEIIIKNNSSITSAVSSLGSLSENLAGIGANGKALRTPTQIEKSLTKANQFMFSQMADSWLDSQPDKLAAYSKWLNNEVTIQISEGSINIRDAMDPEIRQKVDNQLIQNIKNDVYIQKQQRENIEAQQEAFSDEVKKELYIKSQTGELTTSIVEASRNVLDYDDYKDFSKMAIEKDPITNGAVYANLINKIDLGQDVSAQIRNARFNQKALSNSDFKELLDRNSSDKSNQPLPSSIKEGRNFLLGFLGSSAEALDITNSAVIANAEREYNGKIQDFINSNNREPSRQEALDIADQTAERYNIIQLDNISATFPKPKFLPVKAKYSKRKLTEEVMKKAKTDTIKFYKDKYGGDIEKMKQDKEFQEEAQLLEKYEKLIDLNK